MERRLASGVVLGRVDVPDTPERCRPGWVPGAQNISTATHSCTIGHATAVIMLPAGSTPWRTHERAAAGLVEVAMSLLTATTHGCLEGQEMPLDHRTDTAAIAT